jgi:hypothetical protein
VTKAVGNDNAYLVRVITSHILQQAFLQWSCQFCGHVFLVYVI